MTHNHVTRDIKPPGECSGCDEYHSTRRKRGRTADCLPFCQGELHEEGCPVLNEIPQPYMRHVFMTVPEITTLLYALARAADPAAAEIEDDDPDPTKLSAVIWRSDVHPALKSLATMLTEATY